MSRQLRNYTWAIIPEPYEIMGVKLRPFSLGHYFLMSRFGCGFASDDENTMGGIPDLLLGITICSRTYEDFLEFINDEKAFTKWMKKWGKAVRKKLKKDKNYDMIYTFMAFKDYMKNGIVIPKYFEGEHADKGTPSGAHWTQSIFLVAVSELGYSHSEALNSPLSKVLSDYFKWAEANGSIHLMDDDELEIVEKIERGA